MMNDAAAPTGDSHNYPGQIVSFPASTSHVVQGLYDIQTRSPAAPAELIQSFRELFALPNLSECGGEGGI